MQNNNPGHTVGGGYPFEKNESKALWTLEERNIHDKVVGDLKSFYKHVDSIEQDQYDKEKSKTLDRNIELLAFIVQKYKEMLEIAENQIEDMLHEDPFVPETFGFELAHRNAGIHEPPVRIYLSKYNDKYTLFRKPGTPGDIDWNPMAWVLKEKLPDGAFKDIELNLCSHRIAYAAFYALGVQVKEEKGWMQVEMEKAIISLNKDVKMIEEASLNALKQALGENAPKGMGGIYPLMTPSESSGGKEYTVIFFRKPFMRREVKTQAVDYTDAINNAKFLLETDIDSPVSNVMLNELMVRTNGIIMDVSDKYEIPNTQFFVKFKRSDDRCDIHIEKDVYMDADNEIDAMLCAKALLEDADPTYNRDIQPSELSPFITRAYQNRRRTAIEPIGQIKRFHVDSDRGFTQEEVEYAKLWMISRSWRKDTEYRVMFFRAEHKEINGRFVDINASDDSEALSKAKFLLETDSDNPIEDIQIGELSVVK